MTLNTQCNEAAQKLDEANMISGKKLATHIVAYTHFDCVVL